MLILPLDKKKMKSKMQDAVTPTKAKCQYQFVILFRYYLGQI